MPFAWCCIDQAFEAVRTAVAIVGREEADGRVAPLYLLLHVRHRHQLQDVHAKALQVIELIDYTAERAVEFADVELVHHHMVDLRRLERAVSPSECRRRVSQKRREVARPRFTSERI
jgi:hypothetical protein